MKTLVAFGIAIAAIAPPPAASAQAAPTGPAAGDVAAAAAASGPPRLMTEAALACILGAGQKGCESVFAGGARPVALQFMWKAGSLNPYYRTAAYAGRNEAGNEVWEVQFTHTTQTYVISRPDPDGAIRRLSILTGPPDRQCVDLAVGMLRAGNFRATCGVLGSS
jgi:hypothetical protein